MTRRFVIGIGTDQTIRSIQDMTFSQKVELFKAVRENMSPKPAAAESPDWHREYLEDREKAIANGADRFIKVDEFEKDLRQGLPRIAA